MTQRHSGANSSLRTRNELAAMPLRGRLRGGTKRTGARRLGARPGGLGRMIADDCNRAKSAPPPVGRNYKARSDHGLIMFGNFVWNRHSLSV
jgi:hypothetical protein